MEEPVQEIQAEPSVEEEQETSSWQFDASKVSYFFQEAGAFMQVYGWYVIAAVIILAILKQKYLDPYLKKRSRNRPQEGLQYDSDTALRRMEAMEASRRRLQEQHDALTARHAEETKKKEEEKRKAKIEDWDRHQEGKGYRSKMYKPADSPSSSASKPADGPVSKPRKKGLKPDNYNPLGGAGGACSWRPSRSPSGGG